MKANYDETELNMHTKCKALAKLHAFVTYQQEEQGK